jgi:hypothetical protein
MLTEVHEWTPQDHFDKLRETLKVFDGVKPTIIDFPQSLRETIESMAKVIVLDYFGNDVTTVAENVNNAVNALYIKELRTRADDVETIVEIHCLEGKIPGLVHDQGSAEWQEIMDGYYVWLDQKNKKDKK